MQEKHEARFYEANAGKSVRCVLCPHSCIINESGRGICGVRANHSGKLYSEVYARPSSIGIDPIEKKPLYHFLPGSMSLSIGTIGCNLKCMHCQNWEISTARSYNDESVRAGQVSPKELAELASEKGCRTISFTYNEPTVFIEYAIDTATEARKRGIKSVIVSNGFISPGPLKELAKHTDAANIDLKSFDNTFYQKICRGRLQPVLDTISYLYSQGVHIEITNLIIPTLNDDMQLIRRMSEWIISNTGPAVPLHFSAFRPCHRLTTIHPARESTLREARETSLSLGLKNVYVGNVIADEGSNTKCPECGRLLVERKGYSVLFNNMRGDACRCGCKIYGLFQPSGLPGE